MIARKFAEDILLAGIHGVLPERLILEQVRLEGAKLTVGDSAYDLDCIQNVFVLGAGKASGLMAAALESVLGNRITDGLIIVKYGHGCSLRRIRIREAGHPVPDENGFVATRELSALAQAASVDDLVICLLSGGGSALLADFPNGSNPEEMQQLNSQLLLSGADIREINCVRKHLSQVKGGGLASQIFPAQLVCLILSDVVGDPLDVIASGPTVPDPSTYADALRVVERYDLGEHFPPTLLALLRSGAERQIPETPKAGDALFDRVRNVIIGSNSLALQAAARKAAELGVHPTIVDLRLQGDVSGVAQRIIETALRCQADPKMPMPACLLFGGEPTLRVTGKGMGGRNQHLALLCATLIQNRPNIIVAAVGTDGTDGPTDAAGAVADGDTIEQGIAAGIDAEAALRDCDSYKFFRNAGGHVITGPTKTNVMDLIAVLVNRA